MNATTLGKILVYSNLVFSLLLVGWAAGISTNRINWASSKTLAEGEGEQARKTAEIQQRREALLKSRKYWKAEDGEFAAADKKSLEDKKWYGEQLKFLATIAVTSLSYKATGELEIKNGRPVLVPHPDKRLQSRKALVEQLEKQENEIAQELEAVKKLLILHEDLSFILHGNAEKKGLLALLEDAQLAEKNAKAESDHAKKEAIAGGVEAGSLEHRQRQLRARLEELKKIGLAARQP